MSITFEGRLYKANDINEPEMPHHKKVELLNAFIKEHSGGNPWSEWCYLGRELEQPPTRCLCSKTIHNRFRIKNKVTDQEFIVGSECISKFLGDILKCTSCGDSLSGVQRRLLENDLMCRPCKTEQKRHLGNFKFYYLTSQPRFKDVVSDQQLLHEALNVDKRLRKTSTYVALLEYLRLFGVTPTVRRRAQAQPAGQQDPAEK